MAPMKMWIHFYQKQLHFSYMNFSRMMYFYCWNKAISNVTNELQVLEVKFCSRIYPELLETRGDG